MVGPGTTFELSCSVLRFSNFALDTPPFEQRFQRFRMGLNQIA
jgi:hypothetical protein